MILLAVLAMEGQSEAASLDRTPTGGGTSTYTGTGWGGAA